MGRTEKLTAPVSRASPLSTLRVVQNVLDSVKSPAPIADAGMKGRPVQVRTVKSRALNILSRTQTTSPARRNPWLQ